MIVFYYQQGLGPYKYVLLLPTPFKSCIYIQKCRWNYFIYFLSSSIIQRMNPTVWLSWRQLQRPTPPQPNRNSALFDRCLPASADDLSSGVSPVSYKWFCLFDDEARTELEPRLSRKSVSKALSCCHRFRIC